MKDNTSGSARTLRLGTRASTLATTQSMKVAKVLRRLGHDVELVRITTRGDRSRGSLKSMAGVGVFAAELRQALLDGRCDFAVHSLKDLPVDGVPGLLLAAIPAREDPRDALCARDGMRLLDLPVGARLGTGSPRRVAQLKAARPDLEYVDIRGNIDTRLARVAPGDLDAVVLAAAGLNRLGLHGRISELLDILPAPGQGALALECRSDDAEMIQILAALDDSRTRAAVTAERALLRTLGGGCAAPIAARGTLAPEDSAEETADSISQPAGAAELTGGVFALDGSRTLVDSVPLTDPEEAGAQLARRLLAGGADDICDLKASRESRLAEFHPPAETNLWPVATPLAAASVFLPREWGPISEAIEAAGPSVHCEPLIRTVPLPVTETGLGPADWVVLTSRRTLERLRALGWEAPAGSRVAAVGPATARVARRAGYPVDLVPGGPFTAAELVREFPAGGGRVVIPGSALSSPELADGLRGKGWEVAAIPVYTVEAVAAPSPELADRWQQGDFDAVVVTSGSLARAIDLLLGWPATTRVVAFGQPTAQVLAELGVACTVVPLQDPDSVVATLVALLRKGQA